MTNINSLPIDSNTSTQNELKIIDDLFKSNEEIAKVKKGLAEFKVILLGTILFTILTILKIKLIYKILLFAFIFSLIYIRFFN